MSCTGPGAGLDDSSGFLPTLDIPQFYELLEGPGEGEVLGAAGKVEGWVLQGGFRAMECPSPPAQPWDGITHLMDALCHSPGPTVPLLSWDRLGRLAYADCPCGLCQCPGSIGVLWVILWVMLCVTTLLSEEAMGDSQSRQ